MASFIEQWKPFKNDEKYFLFHLKSFFCFYFIMVKTKKPLDQKDKANFKIYYVTTWS